MLGTRDIATKHVPGRVVSKLLHIGISRESLKPTGTWHPLLDFLILLVWDTSWALGFFNGSLGDSNVQQSLGTTALVFATA